MLSYFLYNLWLWKCGYPEQTIAIQRLPSLDELKHTEWSPKFEELMRNRLIMGAIRYGRLNAKGKPQYDRIASIFRRLSLYQETGNKEILVDIANICLCEFEECDHPNQHFYSGDSEEHIDLKQIKEL